MKPQLPVTLGNALWLSVCLWLGAVVSSGSARPEAGSWRGSLRDAAGNAVANAKVELCDTQLGGVLIGITDGGGQFIFSDLRPGTYSVRVHVESRTCELSTPLEVRVSQQVEGWLELSLGERELTLHLGSSKVAAQASGGEQLSTQDVSGLPLNKRDFSQLLLLAAGTRTDINGSVNYTQQFSVNGQRGTTAVFMTDGIYTTDPEVGGAAFSNFNVDAIQEIRSSSGVMAAEIGRGAAAHTDIITKTGTSQLHGSLFEFHRNSALDARNYFDRRSTAESHRLPPFIRNEFGMTLGGPVVLPGLYSGGDRTFFFTQYQGFRQVLSTTEVLSVPTAAERAGLNTTAFPGDTLRVPVSPLVAPVLAHYPLPNDPLGPYGPRTYATSTKVTINTDQFSVRFDHRFSDSAQVFVRFNLNQVKGPLSNPSQTAIDPGFAIRFFDHQRNLGITYTRILSPQWTSTSALGYLRTTPSSRAINDTQPGLKFSGGLYEPFNSAAGSVNGAYANLFQVRQDFVYVEGSHTIKMGAEARLSRHSEMYGMTPNGSYTFGGGPAYAQVEIASASGRNDIHVGDLLPDTLTGFLTATPSAYRISVGGKGFPQADKIGLSANRREAYNFYFQDNWKVAPRLMLNWGLRYELNTPFREAHHLTAGTIFVGPDGQPTLPWAAGVRQKYLVNPDPPYATDWGGLGPRLSLTWRIADKTVLTLGGAMTTLLPTFWHNNSLWGTFPYVVDAFVTARPDVPVRFENTVTQFNLPVVFTPEGEPVFASGRSTDVPPNTEVDVLRFQKNLASLNPGTQTVPLLIQGTSRDFRNGYIGTYTAGIEHRVGSLRVLASYVSTAGVKLTSFTFPNSYAGADPSFARFTNFEGGQVSGFGIQYLMSNRAHSAYHSMQTSVTATSLRTGTGFQSSYTLGKSLDNSSGVTAGSPSAGTLLPSHPQDPTKPGSEKGPSNFDVRHVLSFKVIQDLRLDRLAVLRPLGRNITSGWQLMSLSSLSSGLPFTVFSGIQQTGAGSIGADRPDQVGSPTFSTSRQVREDYFGLGERNVSFFYVPIGLPGGTGPNKGRFGTLGRNTFRGPGFRNADIALLKEITFGRRRGAEAITLQLRAEFFNVFNIANFGMPTNSLRGSGFGFISYTAGTSRQIQIGMKILF